MFRFCSGMKFKVHFTEYEGYWVAEAENGAVSEGKTLEECRSNISDAIAELERDPENIKIRSEVEEVLEVPV
jgi:predicted RNase H-like HicB family nuclease